MVKIEKILTVTYNNLLSKTTIFSESDGQTECVQFEIISYST